MNLERLVTLEVTLDQLISKIRSYSALYDTKDELGYVARRLDEGKNKLNEVIGKEFVKSKHKIEF